MGLVGFAAGFEVADEIDGKHCRQEAPPPFVSLSPFPRFQLAVASLPFEPLSARGRSSQAADLLDLHWLLLTVPLLQQGAILFQMDRQMRLEKLEVAVAVQDGAEHVAKGRHLWARRLKILFPYQALQSL